MHKQLQLATRRGASAIIAILLLVVLMIFASMAINLAHLQRQHSASQIAADLGVHWGIDCISRNVGRDEIKSDVEFLLRRNTGPNRSRDDWAFDDQLENVKVEFGAMEAGEFVVDKAPLNAIKTSSMVAVKLTGVGVQQGKFIDVDRNAVASVGQGGDVCLVVHRGTAMTYEKSRTEILIDTSWHPYNAVRGTSFEMHWWWHWPHPDDSHWGMQTKALYRVADNLAKSGGAEFSIVSYSYFHTPRIIVTHQNAPGSWRWWGSIFMGSYDCDQNAIVEVPPTFDYRAAIDTLNHKYSYDKPLFGRTDIGAGIDAATNLLTGPTSRSGSNKAIIVLNVEPYDRGREPWLASADAALEGITVHTISVGPRSWIGQMEKIAVFGNGKHIHVRTEDDIVAAIESLMSSDGVKFHQ